MEISKEFKDTLMKQFSDWIDENLKKGDVLQTSQSQKVIVFTKTK